MQQEEIKVGGIYKHFKGTLVKVLGICKDSENLEDMVYYIHLEDGVEWVRPLEMFLGYKEKDGEQIKRFELQSGEIKILPNLNK
jgi:hypothetical protein